MEKFAAGLTQAEINIGTGQGHSNLEIMNMIQQVTDMTVPYTKGPRREGDVTRLYANGDRAKAVLGFTPQESTLDHIIATAWNFHKTRF